MNVTGTSGNETLNGGAAADVIDGLAGNDSLRGRGGDDSILGGLGDDTLIGGSGNDTLDGGDGFDFASYFDDGNDGGGVATTGKGVNVNLATGKATDNWGFTDTLVNIDQLRGSAFADVLTGGAIDSFEGFQGDGGNDTIDGGTGFDRIYYTGATVAVAVTLGGATPTSFGDGVGGTDTVVNIEEVRASAFNDTLTGSDNSSTESFEGRAGNDYIDGKGGNDRANYQSSTAAVNVDLVRGSATDGFGGTDTLVNIESARGSDFNDTLTGNDAFNNLDGRAGNDLLSGAAGEDTLTGGAGDDTLDGGSQLKQLDTANQNNEYDRAVFSDATGGVTVLLAPDGQRGSATGAGIGTDVLINIEYVVGSDFDDLIVGTDRIYNEIFRGNAGNDTLRAGTGSALDGGFDQVSYFDATGGVTVNLSTGRASGADGNDVLEGFEGVLGSHFADAITGNEADNYFQGYEGDDTIDGASGRDIVSYETASAGMLVDLARGTSSGPDGTDVLISIESIRGSTLGDTLIGSDGDNLINGRAGNDSVSAGAGADTVSGGLGDDTLDGGAGLDVLSYNTTTSAVTVNLGIGQALGEGTDQVSGFEEVRGSVFADSITGDSSDNTLVGNAGNDTLDGDVGFDTARFTGPRANYTIVDRGGGAWTVTDRIGSDGSDTLSNIENLVFADSDTTAPTVLDVQPPAGSIDIDPAGNIVVTFSEGVVRGSGSVAVKTGTGAAVATFDAATSAALTFSGSTLTINPPSDLPYGTSLVLEIDKGAVKDLAGNAHAGLRGHSFSTVTGVFLVGVDATGALPGGASLQGTGGVDSVNFAAARAAITVDLAAGTASGPGGTVSLVSIEVVVGSSFADSINGSAAENTFTGGQGNDTINGGAGTDTAVYADASAAVTIDLSSGTATGGAGADTLIGIENAVGSNFGDTLKGTSGGNRLDGGAGADRMEGGRGADVYVVDDAGDLVMEADNTPAEGDGLLAHLDIGSATDTVIASISYTLGNFLEILQLTGTADLSGTGNALANRLEGNAGSNVLQSLDGNDELDGGAGADRMEGGRGADTYYVDNTGDLVIETDNQAAAGAGDELVALDIGSATDKVIASVSFTLGNFVEILELAGSDALAGAGNALDNRLVGNSGNNNLTGGAGNDEIDGGAGADTAMFSGAKSAYSVLATGSNPSKFTVSSATEGTDTLTSIERLAFADVKLAFDVSANGAAAGNAALLLAALAGKGILSNKPLVGAVIGLLDAGQSLEQIAALGLGALLGPSATNVQIATLLFTHVVGAAPDASTAAAVAALMDSGAYTQSAFTAAVAQLDLNKASINLTGLAQTGIEYV